MKKILIFFFLFLFLLSANAREKYNFNSDWKIDMQKGKVTLPHAWNENESFRVSTYEMSNAIVWYRKEFKLPASAQGNKVFIEFEGAKHAAEVWLNGKKVGINENGVMAFGFDLTPYLKDGKNLIEVKTDNSDRYHEEATKSAYQWNTRAFFANYGGLSKNVWLHITDEVYQTLPLYSNLGTTGTYIYAKDYAINERTATIHAESQVKNESNRAAIIGYEVIVEEKNGKEIARFQGEKVTIPAGGIKTIAAEKRVSGLHFWSWGYGYLYNVKTRLVVNGSAVSDEVCTTTGFRKTEYKEGKIYLNDRVIMVHGYAQRSTNEWPGVGQCVPAWMSDYSNNLFVKSGGNLVRWMHVTPWKQDIESCDRVGLIQAMPAADAESDTYGRRWEHRLELMRDAIIYNKNNPSILFYECGNQRITAQHMIEMKKIRNVFDSEGGRAIGCREMLDQPEAEYGGEMLYINKSDTKPMWMMEYCRDEAHRFFWNSWSYPFHKEGDGPLYRGDPATAYNHNNDEFVVECVRRWYDYYLERPGTGTKCNSGGTKIVFSDTQTHGRSADNYRVSGVVDPMRIEKDAFYAHQVIWDAWVEDFNPRTYICGHWNYEMGFKVPTIYVVSNADSVALLQNGKLIPQASRDYRFLFTYKDVAYEAGEITAIGYNKDGKEESRWQIKTAGAPAHLKLTSILNPTGWKADGADCALVQVEVVDKNGQRCPLDNRLIKWQIKGQAEFLGGIAKNKPYDFFTNDAALKSKSLDAVGDAALEKIRKFPHLNHAGQDTIPVECGVNRVILRSLTKAGKVTIIAKAEGMADAEITLSTEAIEVKDGLTKFFPANGLMPILDRGETPSTPSFTQKMVEVPILSSTAGSNADKAYLTHDGYEKTEWASINGRDSAWISWTLIENTRVDEVCIKMSGFRNTSYPIVVLAGDKEVWRGNTPKSLSYVRLPLKDCPVTNKYTIRLAGDASIKDAFGAVKELDVTNDEITSKARKNLKILEIEFLKNVE